MEVERGELEQQRNKVAALQFAVVDKDKMQVKLATMEGKMGHVTALEQQVAATAEQLANCRELLAVFQQTAADERVRKLGPMAKIVPASLDKWATMPKSPFGMPSFSTVPSVSLPGGLWRGRGDFFGGEKKKSVPFVGASGGFAAPVVRARDLPFDSAELVAGEGGGAGWGQQDLEDLECKSPPLSGVLEQWHPSRRQGENGGTRAEGRDARAEGSGGGSRRELELERQLEELQLEVKQQRIYALDLSRKLLHSREKVPGGIGKEELHRDDREGAGGEVQEGEVSGSSAQEGEASAQEDSWQQQWRKRKDDGNLSKEEEDAFMVLVRQKLTQARAARATAEQVTYTTRRELAATQREAEEEKRALIALHREHMQELLESRTSILSEEDSNELMLRLRIAQEEAEGAHEAARVADAAANVAEKRVREVEVEGHDEFIKYRDRETKSREHSLSMASKVYTYEVASISRLLKIIGLFCKRTL